ncbi:MAG: hypothetical protein QXI39_04890 [Candidatus Bathyarchaeia archaeon]
MELSQELYQDIDKAIASEVKLCFEETGLQELADQETFDGLMP